MEPVPETERMEAFRSSPLPMLRLHSLSEIAEFELPQKPPTVRRCTEPASPSSPSWTIPANLPYRPRTTSPLSGISHHTRSRSAASTLAPPMIRTQSLPGANGAGHILFSPQRSSSPSRSPIRPQQVRLPRKPADEAFPTSPTRTSVFDQERRVTERNSVPNLSFAGSSVPLARVRRPASPLRHVNILGGASASGASSPTTPSSSYRSYDSISSYTSATSMTSSIPSTPTSTRSRSPSISSLETIPDSPDAEEAALEAERIAQLKAAADAADRAEGSETKGRSSLDVPSRGRTLGGFGSRDKRKRWSVCGAERRGDIDLETVWEE